MRMPDWLMSTRGMAVFILCLGLVVICYRTNDPSVLAGIVGGSVAGYLFARGEHPPNNDTT